MGLKTTAAAIALACLMSGATLAQEAVPIKGVITTAR